MPEGMRWVGLDVHARETACAIFDGSVPRRPQDRPDPHLLELRFERFTRASA